MPEDNDKRTPLIEAFYVRPLRIASLPEGLRAWITIAAIVALIALVASTMLSAILLVRLGWDALWSKPPDNQEIIKNFLLAFASHSEYHFLFGELGLPTHRRKPLTCSPTCPRS
jgi:hypothetical protein